MANTTKIKLFIDIEMEIPGKHDKESLGWWIDRFQNPIITDKCDIKGEIIKATIEKNTPKIDEKQRELNLHKKIISDAIGKGFKYKSIKGINNCDDKIEVYIESSINKIRHSIIIFYIKDGVYKQSQSNNGEVIVSLCNPEADNVIRNTVKGELKRQMDRYSKFGNLYNDYIKQLEELYDKLNRKE
jgi:hypothetical protein